MPLTNTINWAELYLVAESDNEEFTHLQIVTAKSEFVAKARQLAISQLIHEGKKFTSLAIDDRARRLITTNQISVHEQASVTDVGAFVVMEADVIDDDVSFQALDLVYAAVNNGGMWESNKPLVYTFSELEGLLVGS